MVKVVNADYVSKALQLVLKLNDVCASLRGACADVLGADFERECGEAIARRAEDMPQLVYSIGLVPTLTLYMSKVEDWIITTLLAKYLIDSIENVAIDPSKLVEWLIKYSKAEARKRVDERLARRRASVSEEERRKEYEEERERIYNYMRKRLCNEFSSSSSAGYATMLSVVIAYLHSINRLDKAVADSVNNIVQRIENEQNIDVQTMLDLAKKFSQYLLDLRKSGELVVMHHAITFLLELKKIAKAILEKEK